MSAYCTIYPLPPAVHRTTNHHTVSPPSHLWRCCEPVILRPFEVHYKHWTSARQTFRRFSFTFLSILCLCYFSLSRRPEESWTWKGLWRSWLFHYASSHVHSFLLGWEFRTGGRNAELFRFRLVPYGGYMSAVHFPSLLLDASSLYIMVNCCHSVRPFWRPWVHIFLLILSLVPLRLLEFIFFLKTGTHGLYGV